MRSNSLAARVILVALCCLNAVQQSFCCLFLSIFPVKRIPADTTVPWHHAAWTSVVGSAGKMSWRGYCPSVKRQWDLRRNRNWWEPLWPELFPPLISCYSSFSLKLKVNVFNRCAVVAHVVSGSTLQLSWRAQHYNTEFIHLSSPHCWYITEYTVYYWWEEDSRVKGPA